LGLLGWRAVHAPARELSVRWVARDVAVDGLVFGDLTAGGVRLSAEMDPPGGWVDVGLDLRTGRELWRGAPAR